jgi:hypothetical protein
MQAISDNYHCNGCFASNSGVSRSVDRSRVGILAFPEATLVRFDEGTYLNIFAPVGNNHA